MQQRLVGPAWGERTPLCTSLAKHWSDTRQQKYRKMFLERQLYLSFLLPCSWICCWSVYIAFLPLRFSFWLLVGSTSLVPVGPFLLHAVLAVDMLQCDESEIKWEIEWNWSLQIGTFSKKVFPQGQISSNSSRSKACSPNSWGNEGKGHLDLRVSNSCGPGWLNLYSLTTWNWLIKWWHI